MEIKVNGHSGCTIEVMNRGNHLCLVKSTSDVKYINRLIEQAEKQKKYAGHRYKAVKIPEILNIVQTPDQCHVEMEYIYSKNFVDFLETSNIHQIDTFISSVCHFVDAMISRSEMKKVPAEVVICKFEDVVRKIQSNSYCRQAGGIDAVLERSAKIIRSCPDLYIPVGACHGDLTLSNVLFNGYVYYLIDFLDSFIESPLMDVVKLRQDTAYHWSVLMYNGDFATARMNLIMDRMDDRIREHFASYLWYKEFYGIFQLMNFLRILQYAHEERIVVYLRNSLIHILDHEF